MFTTLKIKIKRALFTEEIETIYQKTQELHQDEKLKFFEKNIKLLEKSESGIPPWNPSSWKNVLKQTAIEVAKHANSRIASMMLDIESGKITGKVLQSYGRRTDGISKLPLAIKTGIGSKIGSNTNTRSGGMPRFSKRPPYYKADFIKIDRQKESPFKFENKYNGVVVTDIDLPSFVLQQSKYVELLPHEKGKTVRYGFFLDLRARQKNKSGRKLFKPLSETKNWNIPGSYENLIRQLVEGKIFSNSCEIVKKDNDFYIHFAVAIEKKDKSDTTNVCGVDIGMRNAVFAHCNGKHYSISGREFFHLKKMQYRRQKEKSYSNHNNRTGHGIKNKFKSLTQSTEKNQKREESWINRTAKSFYLWYAHTKSILQVEDIDLVEKQKHKEIKFPYKKILNRIVELATREGHEVQKINPQYTSQRCSECGYINSQYTFEFRNDKKNYKDNRPPGFWCDNCGCGKDKYFDGDENSSKNISIKDIDTLIAKQLKLQKISSKFDPDDI